jgi:hypothetical protein
MLHSDDPAIFNDHLGNANCFNTSQFYIIYLECTSLEKKNRTLQQVCLGTIQMNLEIYTPDKTCTKYRPILIRGESAYWIDMLRLCCRTDPLTPNIKRWHRSNEEYQSTTGNGRILAQPQVSRVGDNSARYTILTVTATGLTTVKMRESATPTYRRGHT